MHGKLDTYLWLTQDTITRVNRARRENKKRRAFIYGTERS
jgi:hypothetical protein